jgi:uncharacterized protein YqhQ
MASLRYGGQALVEGVLMRGRGAIAVALRHPDGRIVYATEPLTGGFRGTRRAKLPFVRGLVVLYETLVTGTRWLVRSANLAASEEGVELGKGGIALMLTITLALGIGLFFFLPLIITRAVLPTQGGLLEHAVEGCVQVGIFLGYLLLIGQAHDVRRTFQYHGAEHMSIHALENGDPLTTERVRPYPTAHPRCGTEFLVVVIIISIICFSLIGRQSIPVTIISRLILIPIIAAVAYEILQYLARHESNPIMRALTKPGIWVQRITTKRPSDDQIEVAIVSLQEALRADGQEIPAGSAEFPRVLLADVEAEASVKAAVGPEPAPGHEDAPGDEDAPVGPEAAPGVPVDADAPVDPRPPTGPPAGLEGAVPSVVPVAVGEDPGRR